MKIYECVDGGSQVSLLKSKQSRVATRPNLEVYLQMLNSDQMSHTAQLALLSPGFDVIDHI